jgi:RNA-directed DNA polymerase
MKRSPVAGIAHEMYFPSRAGRTPLGARLTFEQELSAECKKLITRYERYVRELRDDDRRRTRRTGFAHRGTIMRPSYWAVDRSFDPYRVRSSIQPISRALKLALRHHDYQPYNPIAYEVPKSDGTTRIVSVFSVADSLVSRRVYASLLEKNKPSLSAYSYAYRDDLTVHDAIHNIGADLRSSQRVFLAEYDFSKYFDSISHEYVWKVLEERQFLTSSLERLVLHGFLQSTLQSQDDYQRRTVNSVPVRTSGLPQGTSVSLFLANVAAWELDRALERIGVGFARYADDTLIWSHDYSRICDAVQALSSMASEIGASLNFKKSPGISIFTPDGSPAEFSPKRTVEFVGYRFGPHGRGLRASVVGRAKKKMAYIIWSNLLEPLVNGQVVAARVAPLVDRDYLVMVMQLRRYLYGDLNEEKLVRLLDGRSRRIRFNGLMSFFPMIEDMEQLKALDGWLLHTVFTSLRRREVLLIRGGLLDLPKPHGLTKDELLKAFSETSSGVKLDLRLPSFVRIGTAIRRAAAAHGPNSVGQSGGPIDYWYK